MVKAVLPNLRHPGRIISISSVGARATYPGVGTYAASKAALEGYTRTWAAEFGKDGTTANTVNPGPVESEMLDQVSKEIVEPQKKATLVQQRVGTPEEIAEIVAFLAEPRSSWVSFYIMELSGGMLMLGDRLLDRVLVLVVVIRFTSCCSDQQTSLREESTAPACIEVSNSAHGQIPKPKQ